MFHINQTLLQNYIRQKNKIYYLYSYVNMIHTCLLIYITYNNNQFLFDLNQIVISNLLMTLLGQ